MEVKLGDILKMSDASLATVWTGKMWTNARFKILSILEEPDPNGNPIVMIERLDLPSRTKQSWSTKWFEKNPGTLKIK